VHRVARRVHPFGKEHAALLGFGVIAEHAVALVLEAGLRCSCLVVGFLFAVAKESAVLFALATPAHAGASVEHADAATRDHDVELPLLHVATDVGNHDDDFFALDGADVDVVAVLALAGEGELVALAAGAAVGRGHCREGEAHFVTAVDGERDLAGAGHLRSAAADTAVAPVAVLALALVGALPGVVAARVFGPGAVGLAAIPVTGCPAAAGSAAALGFDVGALAGLGRTALHGAAALYGGATALHGAAALVVVTAV